MRSRFAAAAALSQQILHFYVILIAACDFNSKFPEDLRSAAFLVFIKYAVLVVF